MNNDQKKVVAQTSNTLLKSVVLISVISGYIFGPMIVFGGIGIWLGQKYESIWYPVVFLFFALIISNILIFKRSGNLSKKFMEKK